MDRLTSKIFFGALFFSATVVLILFIWALQPQTLIDYFTLFIAWIFATAFVGSLGCFCLSIVDDIFKAISPRKKG